MRKWRRLGRQRLPEGLPRRRIEYELSAEELPCPDCGHPRAKIGEEASPEDTAFESHFRSIASFTQLYLFARFAFDSQNTRARDDFDSLAVQCRADRVGVQQVADSHLCPVGQLCFL